MITVRFLMSIRSSFLTTCLAEVLTGLLCTSEADYPHQRCLLTVPETLCQALPGARSSVPRIHSRTHALPGERVLDREPLHPHIRTHDLKYFREAGNNK